MCKSKPSLITHKTPDVVKHFLWNSTTFNVKLLVRLSIQLYLNVLMKFSLVEFDTSSHAYLPRICSPQTIEKHFAALPFGLWRKVLFFGASICVKCGVRKRKVFNLYWIIFGDGKGKIHWSVFLGRDGMNNNFKFTDESPYRMTSSARPPALLFVR